MNSKSAGYPRFRLFTPNPPDFFFLERSLTKKNQADPLASMLADWFFNRLYPFQIRLVLFQIRLVVIISLRHHLILYVNVNHTYTNTDHKGTGKGTTESRLDFSQQNCVLKNNSGFGWNSDLKLPTAQCEVWDDYCATHPSARLYKTTTLP